MDHARHPKETENQGRKPGQRPDLREREELLLAVERAVARGARNPGHVLADVPELGTWDTAKAYLDEVRARWREASEKEALRAARGEMVAAVRVARGHALSGLALAEKPSEIARLVREVERLVRCEAWLLGLDPETLERDESDFSDDEGESDEDRLLRQWEKELGLDQEGGENPPDPSTARTDDAEPPTPA